MAEFGHQSTEVWRTPLSIGKVDDTLIRITRRGKWERGQLPPEPENLLIVYPDGRVEAPSIEAASEAGRIFVESIRHWMKADSPSSPENADG